MALFEARPAFDGDGGLRQCQPDGNVPDRCPPQGADRQPLHDGGFPQEARAESDRPQPWQHGDGGLEDQNGQGNGRDLQGPGRADRGTPLAGLADRGPHLDRQQGRDGSLLQRHRARSDAKSAQRFVAVRPSSAPARAGAFLFATRTKVLAECGPDGMALRSERTRDGDCQKHDLPLVRQGRRGRGQLLCRDVSRQRGDGGSSRARRLSLAARRAMC